MLPSGCTIHGLLLAGGQSTRMGQPKWTLKLPNGKPVYQHLLDALQASLPIGSRLHLSLRNADQKKELGEKVDSRVAVLYDPQVEQIQGPASGLLAAFEADPQAHWLVLACDYPMMTIQELQRLLQEFHEPVTCLQNKDGFTEPLIGIWSPGALGNLLENVAQGRTGPTWTFRRINGYNLHPLKDEHLFNTNTPEEWKYAMTTLEKS